MASATNTCVTRALFTALLAAVCLAIVPAAAVAQDAGTQQYSDPLAGTGSHTSTQAKAPTPTTTTSTATASGTQSTQSSSSSSTSSSKAAGLPRTGLDVVWLALTGVLLLGGGVALRRAAEPSDA